MLPGDRAKSGGPSARAARQFLYLRLQDLRLACLRLGVPRPCDLVEVLFHGFKLQLYRFCKI